MKTVLAFIVLLIVPHAANAQAPTPQQSTAIPFDQAPCSFFTKRGNNWIILQSVRFGYFVMPKVTLAPHVVKTALGDPWQLIEDKCGPG